MEKSIIEEIYMNNESFGKRVVFNEQYKKLSDKALKCYNQFTAILNDEQKKLFEKFLDLEMDACGESEFLHFKEGVKVGLLLAMESLV